MTEEDVPSIGAASTELSGLDSIDTELLKQCGDFGIIFIAPGSLPYEDEINHLSAKRQRDATTKRRKAIRKRIATARAKAEAATLASAPAAPEAAAVALMQLALAAAPAHGAPGGV